MEQAWLNVIRLIHLQAISTIAILFLIHDHGRYPHNWTPRGVHLVGFNVLFHLLADQSKGFIHVGTILGTNFQKSDFIMRLWEFLSHGLALLIEDFSFFFEVRFVPYDDFLDIGCGFLFNLLHPLFYILSFMYTNSKKFGDRWCYR